MSEGMEQASGWMISGFQAWIALWVWIFFMVAYGVWRSLGDAKPDTIRPSGPLG